MVSIIENWTEVTGEVLSVNKRTDLADIFEIMVRIIEMKQHEDFPNLMRVNPDASVPIRVKSFVLENMELVQGTKIRGLVRSAGGNVYFFNPESIKIL